MALDYSTTNLEYNGGGVGIYQINPASYSAPTAYTDYVQLGATDGVSLEYTTDNTEVRCDQTFAVIDNPMMATSCKVTITCEAMTAELIAKAMGLDITSADDYKTGQTDLSMIEEGSVTTTQTYAGGMQSLTYYDLQFEKERSHDSDKIIGFRIPKAVADGDITLAFKHGELDFYEIKFTALAFDLDDSAPYYKELFYFFEEE